MKDKYTDESDVCIEEAKDAILKSNRFSREQEATLVVAIDLIHQAISCRIDEKLGLRDRMKLDQPS